MIRVGEMVSRATLVETHPRHGDTQTHKQPQTHVYLSNPSAKTLLTNTLLEFELFLGGGVVYNLVLASAQMSAIGLRSLAPWMFSCISTQNNMKYKLATIAVVGLWLEVRGKG